MSITKVARMPESRGLEETRGGSSKVIRTPSITYIAHSDSREDEYHHVLADARIPLRGSVFPGMTGLGAPVCKSREAVRSAASIREEAGGPEVWQWTVTLEYSNEGGAPAASPLHPDTPAKRAFTFEKMQVPVYKDRDGKPIVNTVGDPMNPPLVVEYMIPIETITVNLSTTAFTSGMLLTYFMAVNSDTFHGWAAGKVRVDDISATEASYEDNDGNVIPYWVVTIKLAYNDFGWQPELLNQGLRSRFVADGPIGPTLDNDMKEVTVQTPLTEAGLPLFGAAATPEACHWIKFTIYNEISLSGLDY
jgi:hypothetical protein